VGSKGKNGGRDITLANWRHEKTGMGFRVYKGLRVPELERVLFIRGYVLKG
jgi:hypothetical protein